MEWFYLDIDCSSCPNEAQEQEAQRLHELPRHRAGTGAQEAGVVGCRSQGAEAEAAVLQILDL